jgi:hypothetical protein
LQDLNYKLNTGYPLPDEQDIIIEKESMLQSRFITTQRQADAINDQIDELKKRFALNDEKQLEMENQKKILYNQLGELFKHYEKLMIVPGKRIQWNNEEVLDYPNDLDASVKLTQLKAENELQRRYKIKSLWWEWNRVSTLLANSAFVRQYYDHGSKDRRSIRYHLDKEATLGAFLTGYKRPVYY